MFCHFFKDICLICLFNLLPIPQVQTLLVYFGHDYLFLVLAFNAEQFLLNGWLLVKLFLNFEVSSCDIIIRAIIDKGILCLICYWGLGATNFLQIIDFVNRSFINTDSFGTNTLSLDVLVGQRSFQFHLALRLLNCAL